MPSRSPFDPSLPMRPWDWWRGADELWRCGARLQELWLDELADDRTRAATRQRRIAALLQHARMHSGFYRRHYRHVPRGCTDLPAHPPVTRAALMAKFDQWVTDPQIRLAEIRHFVEDPGLAAAPYLERYAVWTSSGTTGVPGIYVQDADALAIYGALMSLQFDFIPMGDPWDFARPTRIALVAATGGHFAGVVWWQRLCRMHPALASQARVFSILDSLPELTAQLQDWQPSAIASYPTVLAQLAAEQRAGRLDIRPRSLLSGGEVLTEADRQAITEAFDCSLIEDYGASECMSMAHGCKGARMHVNDSWVALEPVDERMRPVPAGEPSFTVLVTNLANRVQPIIRYDLGDSVTIDTTPCECGSRRPSLRVAGRRDDVLSLTGREGRTIRVLPLAVETVIEDEAGICRFQLTQTSGCELSLRIEVDERNRNQAFDRVRTTLQRFLEAQGATGVQITLDPAAPQVNAVSGKLRRICVLGESPAPR